MAEPNYAVEMKLPTGATCADCRHGARCDGLFGAVRKAFTSCDFWPSKFEPAALALPAPVMEGTAL